MSSSAAFSSHIMLMYFWFSKLNGDLLQRCWDELFSREYLKASYAPDNLFDMKSALREQAQQQFLGNPGNVPFFSVLPDLLSKCLYFQKEHLWDNVLGVFGWNDHSGLSGLCQRCLWAVGVGFHVHLVMVSHLQSTLNLLGTVCDVIALGGSFRLTLLEWVLFCPKIHICILCSHWENHRTIQEWSYC